MNSTMSDSDKPPSPAGGADRSAAASSPSGAVLAAQETEAPAERVRKHLRAHGGSRLAEFVVDGYPPYGSDVAAPSPSGGGPSASSSWLSCILGTRTFDESVLEDENTMLNLSDLGITDDSLLDEEEKEKRQISQVRYLLLKDSVSTTVQRTILYFFLASLCSARLLVVHRSTIPTRTRPSTHFASVPLICVDPYLRSSMVFAFRVLRVRPAASARSIGRS